MEFRYSTAAVLLALMLNPSLVRAREALPFNEAVLNPAARSDSRGVSRRPASDPILVGEKIDYDVTYLGMPAIQFTLKVLPLVLSDGHKCYHIRGEAESGLIMSLIYRIKDSIETEFDYEGLVSRSFHLSQEETKQSRDALEQNDSERTQTTYTNHWHPKGRDPVNTQVTASIPRNAQDSLSALYFLRTLPLRVGSVFEIPVVSEGDWYEAVVTVLNHEELEVRRKTYPALRIKVEKKTKEGVIQKSDNYVWISDDDRRIPLRVQAKARIGTFALEMTKYEAGKL